MYLREGPAAQLALLPAVAPVGHGQETNVGSHAIGACSSHTVCEWLPRLKFGLCMICACARGYSCLLTLPAAVAVGKLRQPRRASLDVCAAACKSCSAAHSCSTAALGSACELGSHSSSSRSAAGGHVQRATPAGTGGITQQVSKTSNQSRCGVTGCARNLQYENRSW